MAGTDYDFARTSGKKVWPEARFVRVLILDRKELTAESVKCTLRVVPSPLICAGAFEIQYLIRPTERNALSLERWNNVAHR